MKLSSFPVYQCSADLVLLNAFVICAVLHCPLCVPFVLFNTDLGLDFCSQPAESLQEGLVLWFEGGTPLHILESHVQFS